MLISDGGIHAGGTEWDKARLPAMWHRCKAQSWYPEFESARCACGAMRLFRDNRWDDRNGTRIPRTIYGDRIKGHGERHPFVELLRDVLHLPRSAPFERSQSERHQSHERR